MSDEVFVIAEAGVNHNGDRGRALALVEAAADAGADAVKFQTFTAETLATARAPKAAYQNKTTDPGESQRDMLKALELSHRDHVLLAERAEKCGIEFMSTPFDEQSLRFLVEDINVARLKLGSGEVTNAPLLVEAGRSALPVILSTGMASLDEIAAALGLLATGYAGLVPVSSVATMRERATAQAERLEDLVSLLHCTSAYPAPPEEINLRGIVTLDAAFGLPVGLSDHSEGIAIAIAAPAAGARIVEKHFTLDRSLPGPDHAASIEPDDLKAMVAGIRNVSAALGAGKKEPRPIEEGTKAVARKSLVALAPIAEGEVFSEANLGVKRPEGGLPPIDYWRLLGQPARRDYGPDDLLDPEEAEQRETA